MEYDPSVSGEICPILDVAKLDKSASVAGDEQARKIKKCEHEMVLTSPESDSAGSAAVVDGDAGQITVGSQKSPSGLHMAEVRNLNLSHNAISKCNDVAVTDKDLHEEMPNKIEEFDAVDDDVSVIKTESEMEMGCDISQQSVDTNVAETCSGDTGTAVLLKTDTKYNNAKYTQQNDVVKDIQCNEHYEETSNMMSGFRSDALSDTEETSHVVISGTETIQNNLCLSTGSEGMEYNKDISQVNVKDTLNIIPKNGWIGNDSSRYVDDNDKSEMEMNTSLSAKQITESLMDTSTTKDIMYTAITVSVTDTATNGVTDTSTTKDVTGTTTTDDIMDTSTTEAYKVTTDTTMTEGITETSCDIEGRVYSGAAASTTDTMTLLSKDRIIWSDMPEVVNQKAGVMKEGQGTKAVCSSHEEMGDQQEVDMKEEDKNEHAVGVNLEDTVDEKEEIYITMEGDVAKNESTCAPGANNEELTYEKEEVDMTEVSGMKEEMRDEKEEVEMAKETDEIKEEYRCASNLSHEEMEVNREEVDLPKEAIGIKGESICSPSSCHEEMRGKMEEIDVSKVEDGIKEEAVYAPSPSDDELGVEEDVCSRCSSHDKLGEGQDMKKEGDVCSTDVSWGDVAGEMEGEDTREEGDGIVQDINEENGDKKEEVKTEEQGNGRKEESVSIPWVDPEEAKDKREEENRMEEDSSCFSRGEEGIEKEDDMKEEGGVMDESAACHPCLCQSEFADEKEESCKEEDDKLEEEGVSTLSSSHQNIGDENEKQVNEEGDVDCSDSGIKEEDDMSEDVIGKTIVAQNVDKKEEVNPSEEEYKMEEELVLIPQPYHSETGDETEDKAGERDGSEEGILCRDEVEENINEDRDGMSDETAPCCNQEEIGKEADVNEKDIEIEETAADSLSSCHGEDAADEERGDAVKDADVCSPCSSHVQPGYEEEEGATREEEEGVTREEDPDPLSSSHDDVAAEEDEVTPGSTTLDGGHGDMLGEEDEEENWPGMAGESSVMNLADELAAAMDNSDEDQPSDHATADSEMSSEDESLIGADVSSIGLECEASESKKRRLQQNDSSDTQPQVAAMHAQLAELQLANIDIKDKLKSCECRLSDATVALTVRVEALRDAQTRIQYLEQEHHAKDEALNDAAERIGELHTQADDPRLAAQVDSLQSQLQMATDNLCAAEARMHMLKEELDVHVERNESLQAAVRSRDEEMHQAKERMNLMESETRKQLEWQRATDEVVAGLKQELQERTDSTETYLKEMGDAVGRIQLLQEELDKKNNDLADANEFIQSKQMQAACEAEKNKALKIEMNNEERKALEQLIVTTEHLHKAEELNTSLMGEVTRKTELLSESQARVTALQEELSTKANQAVQKASAVDAHVHIENYRDVNVDPRADSSLVDCYASFIMKDDLLTDVSPDAVHNDNAECCMDCSTTSDEELSEVPLQEIMVSLVKAQQHRTQSQRDAALGRRVDSEEHMSRLQGHLALLGNAVRRMGEEKSALEQEIVELQQAAADTKEAHESEVFKLLESYVDLEDKLKEKVNPLAPVHTGGCSTTKKKRASMFYHPEQEPDVSLDTSVRDHGKEMASLKMEVQQRDNMIMAVKMRAEADRQQLQATIDRLESKVASQNKAHSALVVEMEALHAFAGEMLANEREAHKSEVEQLLLGNCEISQQLSVLNQELKTLIEVKAALEERLRTLDADKEEWEMMLSQQREEHDQELHRNTVELERKTGRTEWEVPQGCMVRRQSQEELLMEKLEQLQERLNSVTDLNESLVQEHKRLKERAAQVEVMNAEMKDCSDCRQDKDALKVKCDAMSAEIEDLHEKVGILRQLSEERQEEMQALMAEKESLGQQLEALKDVSENLQLEKTTLTGEKEDFIKQLAQLKEQVDSLQGEKETEAAKVDDLTGQVAKLKEFSENLTGQLTELKELSENLQEEKETMSEVNLKMLDDAEEMEERVEQLMQQVEQLNQELNAAEGQDKHVELSLLDRSGQRECPREEQVGAVQRELSKSRDFMSSEHVQLVTNKTPTGIKRKLDETGFEDEHLLKKNAESSPSETCATCEVHSAELLQLTTRLQHVLDEKNKLQAVLDTSRCTTATGSQTEDHTTDTLKEQLNEVQTKLVCMREQLQEKDVALSEHQCRISEVETEREQHISLSSELQEQLRRTKEELQEKNAFLLECEHRVTELDEERERLTSHCDSLQEQLTETEEEMRVKSERMRTELENKLETLESALAVERQIVEGLHGNISTLQLEKSVFETESAALQQALADTIDSVADLQAELKVLQTRNECLDKKSAELESRHAILEQREADNEGRLELSRMSLSELEVRAGVLVSRLQDAEAKNRQLESKLNDAVSSLEEARQCKGNIKKELAMTAACLEEANALKCQIEQEFECVKVQLEKAVSEKAEAEGKLKVAIANSQSETSSREKLEERLSTMTAILEDKTKQVAELEEKLNCTAQSLEEVCTEKLQQDTTLEANMSQLKSAEERVELLEQNLVEASEAGKQQTAVIEAELHTVLTMQQESEMRMRQMEAQLGETVEKMEMMEAELKEVSGKKVRVEERLQATVDELEETQQSSAGLREESSRIQGQLAGLQDQLNVATTDGKARQEEVETLRKETDQLRCTLDSLKTENQELQQARGEVAERLKEAEDKYTMKMDEIDRLNADLEEVAKENEKMVQLQASVSETCEERDTLQGKVTLLTSNARRMDRDMKRLQADYDKLYSHKQQGGEQVPQMQDEISNLKREVEALSERLKNEVDELNEKLAKKVKEAASHFGRYNSLLKRYNMLEEENDKLKDELDGPVVTPPRASQRLHKQKMKAGAKRPASEAGLSSMPKKILRGQTQKQYVTMATNHQDVKEDVKSPKAVHSVATGADVKQNDLAPKSKSLDDASSELWVTTRLRSRVHSGGVKQKSLDEKVNCGKELEQRALATISNSPRKAPPATLPSSVDGKPVIMPPLERVTRSRRTLGARDTGKLEAENCKVQ
ncbi:hypothetical protein LSAT2_023414 [Lamellibrachia satsuma]|nr:hypothetical protein LSAT2_023414 [Lamellibrachia satsuma]